jgi:threonine aldolase
MLAGLRDLIAAAARHRRMLGGAMRQIGILAAACDYALTHHLARLPEDHANARALAQAVAGCTGVQCDLTSVQTNIVVFELNHPKVSAQDLSAKAREQGVLLNALGPTKVRLVTHLDVSARQAAQAGDILAGILA